MAQTAWLLVVLAALVSGQDEPVFGGRTASAWVKSLGTPDGHGEAMEALAHLGARALPALIGALDYPDAEVRYYAAHLIGGTRGKARAAIPRLVRALHDDGASVRGSAAEALGEIGSAALVAEPALRELLQDSDDLVRSSAAEALGKVGARQAETIAALVARLNDTGPFTASHAAGALGQLGPHAAEAVRNLVAVFADRDRDVWTRSFAARALGRIGPSARPAVPMLIEVLADKHAPYREFVPQVGAGALVRPDQDLPALKDLADVMFRAPGHRSAAAIAMAQIDPGSQVVADALTQVIGDRSDFFARKPAAQAVGLLGANGKSPVDYLASQLRSPDRSARRDAADLLGSVGWPARAAVPSLVAAFRAADRADRTALEWSLERIARADPDAVVPALMEAWKDADLELRRSVAFTIAELGPLARDALPLLRQAETDPNLRLRRIALRAVRQIDLATADPEHPVETARYLRPAGDRFVPESTIHFREDDNSVRLIVSETDRGSEKLRIVARYSRCQIIDAVVMTAGGKGRRSASAAQELDTARVTWADGRVQEFLCPDGTIVTSAPDWTDAVLLVQRYDRSEGGRQEFPGLWLHPSQPPLRPTFTIERIGHDTVQRDGVAVMLDRFRIELRGGSRYVAWGNDRGRLVRLISDGMPSGGIVLAGWEQLAGALGRAAPP
jgi:HEAT repeat protein